MEGGVSIRTVKLKVLYTFDTEHKNNHLARWPQSIEVQAAPIDETSLIGIVNLRTCLDAVTTASPELTSNSDNDYTVYAYDYSEPDTPLVGQGMLSKAMSPDLNIDADNEAMVTGRISKSVMGLFSKNALETLEVKLRLTPMASPTYQHRRSGSISSNPDVVQQQWNSLAQTNGAFRASSPINTAGLETMQRMLSEGGPVRSASYQQDQHYNTNSRPGSRSGTPVQQSNAPGRQSTIQSRPGSRAGVRQMSHNRRDSFNSGYFSGEDNADEGPARKRARIEKVDIPARSNLNIERQPESLRVVASTASSVRLHRPMPQYAGVAALQNNNLIEEPIRPPTPIAKMKPIRPRGRPRKVISANLLRGPAARRSSPAVQHREDNVEQSLSSPEEVRATSVTSTPADLPSSPPVMPEQSNFVTSPALPPLMGETDSGFMSGNLDDLFNDHLLDFDEFIQDNKTDLPEDDQITDFRARATTTADLPAVFDESNDLTQVSIEMPPPVEKPDQNPVPRNLSRSQSYNPSHRPVLPTPRLASNLAPAPAHGHRGHNGNDIRQSYSMPQIPASDPAERVLHRSNTWAPDMSDAIMSDFGPSREEGTEGKSKKKVGKAQTRARLENAIAAGQMPPFCDNCGAIETPAWRRAFTKIYDTPYDDFQTSLEPGECCYKEPMEHNADGSVRLWKGYRSEKRNDEKTAENDGWVQICLCNPCGLWFHKSKCPRPPEKWQKRDPNEKKKRKRGPKNKRGSNLNRPILRSDAPTPASDDSSPAEGDGEDYGDMTANDEPTDDNEPQLPPILPFHRAGSAEPTEREGRNRFMKPSLRQVQSSPIPGQQPSVPIELDLTPRPLRRQLFPSPDSLRNKANTSGVLVATTTNTRMPTFVRRSPRLQKTRDAFSGSHSAMLVTADGAEKENVAPADAHNDGLADLFDCPDDEFVMPPLTPTPKRRSDRILLKTPSKTPSREFGATLSPNIQSNVKKTPKNKHPAADILISTVQRNLNPSQMTPFTRSIHEALNDTVRYDLPQTPEAPSSGRTRRSRGKEALANANDSFDFPELPSLNGSSPLHVDGNFGVNFSELTTDQINMDYHNIFGPDATMPSSPPRGYFDFINHKDNDVNDFWENMQEDNTYTTTADMHEDGFLSIPDGHEGLRRSPRKQKRVA